MNNRILLSFIAFISFLLITSVLSAQNFEVAGKAKVIQMDKDNNSDSVVVRQDDGTLAVRDVSTLTEFPISPALTGSLNIGGTPRSVYVSGRYAYVVDQGSDDLKVIDVSDPSMPALMGSLGIGEDPISVYVSGRYAYVVDYGSNDLKVIDVTDPNEPTLSGSLVMGGSPSSVHVSGRYAYVVDYGSNDLKVIDVSDPSTPTLIGSLAIGTFPGYVYVSGRYAYVVDYGSNDLKVIDISDPSAPVLSGSLSIGQTPESVYVSGRYAYVLESDLDELKIIDISDPSNPLLSGSLGMGVSPKSVYVSGRYAYVVDQLSSDLKVIDVSDPSSPNLSTSLDFGGRSASVFVSGRYAYLLDYSLDELKVIDISGGEYTSLIAHSLEAGNLQVRNDVIVQGQVQIGSGLNVGVGGIYSDGDLGVTGRSMFANGAVFNGGNVEINTGRLGLGTTNPNWPTHIISPGNAIAGGNVDVSELGLVIARNLNAPNVATGIGFQSSGSTTTVGAAIIHERIGGASSGKLHFATKSSGTPNEDIPIQMTLDQTGKLGIGIINPTVQLDVKGDINATGSINPMSDVNMKESFISIDVSSVLTKISKLPITEWQYKGSSERHIGPMAQDFYAAFGLGQGETTIATVDADGVALVAIQALNEKIENENIELRNQAERQQAEIYNLTTRLEQLEKIILER